MAIVGNKTYQSDSFNLGGDKRMEFILAADKENPEFYIVEVELSKHDFYGHIFPQFTSFS